MATARTSKRCVVESRSAELAIACGDGIGEAPVWDEAQQRLLWVDHFVGIIHEARYDAQRVLRETRRWDLAHHIAAALPCARGGLIIAGRREVFRFDTTGGATPIAAIDEDPLIRINEAKCDARGRLWVGTLSTEFESRAALYRITPDGTVTRMLEGVRLANGFDWSPDGATFYFIDTLSSAVDAFDFDAGPGTIANRRPLIRIEWGAGAPNGMTVDREGCLWIALTGGGEVRRYAPNGVLLERITLPVPGATSCAFGGVDCSDLFITTRSGRMPDIALTIGVRPEMMEATGPAAGALYVCRPGVRGTPAHPWALGPNR
jgi:sugar lactone lactonase YvrE